MTKNELIYKLRDFDDDTPVVIGCSESGSGLKAVDSIEVRDGEIVINEAE